MLGVTYFSTPKKRGTFVKRENLTVYDPATDAAARIQSSVRMSIAKKKAKQEVAWRTFNTLDADDENQHLQRRAKLMGSVLGSHLTRDRPSSADIDSLEKEAAAAVVPPEYDGPHIRFPLTEEQVFSMMEAFKAGKMLHFKYAVALIATYRRMANALPTLVETGIFDGERLTIVGDTHGQLQDLFSIFTINGVPSPTNRYRAYCFPFLVGASWPSVSPRRSFCPFAILRLRCRQVRTPLDTGFWNVQ